MNEPMCDHPRHQNGRPCLGSGGSGGGGSLRLRNARIRPVVTMTTKKGGQSDVRTPEIVKEGQDFGHGLFLTWLSKA